MRASLRVLAVAMLSAFGVAPTVSADRPLDGREIMSNVDSRAQGPDQKLAMTWRLIDASGKERVRKTRSYWRDYRGQDPSLRSKRMVVFDSPPEVRETAFLVWSYRELNVDDDRWIYLPALRKVRRVGGQDRANSFAGTEFTYDDLADREVDDDVHSLVSTEESPGGRVYVVDSVPRDEGSPYARRRLRVMADSWTVAAIDYVDRHDRIEKTLDVTWQKIGPYWDWKRLEMTNHLTGRRTVVEVDEVADGVGLVDSAFSESALRLGVH